MTGRQNMKEKEVNVTLVQGKQCCQCREVKPHSEFGPRRGSTDGLAYECRQCKAAAVRAAYQRKKKDKVLLQRPRPRRPLPEFAVSAGWTLRKDVERLERILADDRYPIYKHQVSAQLRGHLEYAAEVCQDLLSRLDNPGRE